MPQSSPPLLALAVKYGTIAKATSEDYCNSCQRGTYSAIPGSHECQVCPPGSMCPQLQHTHYKSCEAGTYNQHSNQTQCELPGGQVPGERGGGIILQSDANQASDGEDSRIKALLLEVESKDRLIDGQDYQIREMSRQIEQKDSLISKLESRVIDVSSDNRERL